MNFDDLIDDAGLAPDEEAKLRRVHELLVQAGPPPDLPPALESPVEPTDAEVLQFPLLPKRRFAVAAVAAALLVVVGFGGGYLTGHSNAKPSSFAAARVVGMHGPQALAVVRIGSKDDVGNWPMQFEVTGLPTQHDAGAYYELWLTRKGKPTIPCGSFRVHAKTTRVRFTVPYSLNSVDGWVVTEQPAGMHTPGRVVLTT
jgi:hypothetical protein